MLEAILNTLLMNDKSKDTAKARQDLQRLGIRSGLWLSQTKNRKCLKPQAAYSFTLEDRKKFCHFIKGVKLLDGFGSCFKQKVTNNDTNITGLKSHDCHIMMQRLLPYGLQNFLTDKIAKPIIELCSLFKQIYSTNLMEDDMLKAQIKVVDIMCDLELIYPSALFDIMIHLVIYLPLEDLEGRPIRPRWMFPFERYMKKLKGYVRNKAKLEGSIAEGYVAEEALTFSVPKKVLRYFPIIPRLQRLYKSSHTAKDMIWHATGKCTEPGKMQHPVDGGAWKKFDTKYPDFAKEPRNVRLGLAADGFNPFGNLSQAYSMWPDLKVLWDRKGVETIDVASGQKFNMRVMVLWTINNFPARSSLSGWSGQGYKACLTCNEDTPSVRVLSKTAYVGHKRFLKKPHKWRSLREFNGQTDNRDPPKEFGHDEILAQLDRLPTRLTGKHPSYGDVKIKCNVLVELNWTKWSIFYELEYWSFLTLRHNLDIMHIEKNVLEAILNTLLMNDKSKGTAKARQDL
ncbi:zinc finger, PHD-type containing protein [Tanacetum coccineum]